MTARELKDILESCRKFDRKSQAALYRAFYGYGTTLAFHYVNDPEQAKAIYNDAMMKVFGSLNNFRGEAEFQTWLHRIVINAAIDYHRRYFKYVTEAESELQNVVYNAQDIENQLFEQDILLLVQTLAPSYRTVFLLNVMEGFTFKEIAEKLGISEGGAKSLCNSAKMKLRVLLTTYLS